MKFKGFIFLWACFIAIAVRAQTGLITFDDLVDTSDGGLDGTVLQDSYKGLSWNNFYILNADDYVDNPSGYEAGLISAPNVALNGYGDDSTITSDGVFDLVSGYLTAAWNDNLEVEVSGYNFGELMYDQTYTLSSTAPTLITFGFTNVDEVDFTSWGGTPNLEYTEDSGTQFAMDNLTIVQAPGALQVTISPKAAVTSGATWSIDGTTWHASGYTITNLQPDNYTVQFSNVKDWATPDNEVVSVAAGETTVTNGVYSEAGSLEVTISPQGAIDLGAMWSIDGINWNDSGDVLTNVPVGEYYVEFSYVDNWTEPDDVVVTIEQGKLTKATGTYIGPGELQIFITPDSAVAAGAMWAVEYWTDWQNSGDIVSNLPPGDYYVTFLDVDGFTAPDDQLVEIGSEELTAAIGEYTYPNGAVEVTLSPAAAITAGAQWQVDGGAWENSGKVVTNLAVGNHTITYKVLSGWVTPAPNTFYCSDNETQFVQGVYSKLAASLAGSLTVTLTPSAAVSAGAEWQLNGGAWEKSGATFSSLAAGSYNIGFKGVTGWQTPENITATITAGQKTSATAAYKELTNQLQIRMYGRGAISPNDSNAWLQAGTAYSIKATAAAGFKFAGWTNNLTGSTNSATIHFTMESNLMLSVGFIETNRPTVTITNVAKGLIVTNNAFTVKGTATDIVAAASIQVELNKNSWITATGTNRWSANLTLSLGTNNISVYAINAGGVKSATNRAVVVYKLKTPSPLLADKSSGQARSTEDPAAGAAGKASINLAGAKLSAAGFAFSVSILGAAAGKVEASTNLADWTVIGQFANTNATVPFFDPSSNAVRRYYRLTSP